MAVAIIVNFNQEINTSLINNTNPLTCGGQCHMWYAKSKIISVISCSIFFQPEVIHFETFHTCISDSYFFKFYWYKITEHDHQHIHLQNAPLCNSLLIPFRGCQKNDYYCCNKITWGFTTYWPRTVNIRANPTGVQTSQRKVTELLGKTCTTFILTSTLD